MQQVTTNGSSTTVGISTSGNGIGIGTTIPASNKLDIHSGSGINATFNGTGTSNSALQFQLAGTGKWNVGNLYNSNNNDFIITDVVNTLNRVTVKNTGQTFIGADTTSSGLFVVNSSSSDNHIVVLGANSPSIRIRDSGSSLVQNVGLGISTGSNAFIQGSASGNYCIFNSSTTASPILFGVYDAGTGNTQEAIRISAARNLLVGTATDSGYKLSVSGTANISGALTGSSASFSSRLRVNGATDDADIAMQVKAPSGTGKYIMFGRDGSDIAKFTLSAEGAATFSGALSGTSALFSQSANSYALKLLNNAAYPSIIDLSTTTATSTARNWAIYTNGTNWGDLEFRPSAANGGDPYTTGTVALRLSSTGTATFTGAIAIANTVTAAVAVASTHKVTISIGGVTYYLLATNV